MIAGVMRQEGGKQRKSLPAFPWPALLHPGLQTPIPQHVLAHIVVQKSLQSSQRILNYVLVYHVHDYFSFVAFLYYSSVFTVLEEGTTSTTGSLTCQKLDQGGC